MRVAALLLTIAVACLGACGGGGGSGGGETPGSAASPPTPIDPATTGTVTGSVRFEGAVPPMATLRMFAECAALHPEPVPSGDMLVKDGRVENAFVYVKDGLGNRVFPVPATPVDVDQKGCLYHPRVVGVQVGQPIRYLNSDAMLHNVHGSPKEASGWNFALARVGAERVMKIEKPEVMINVRCDLHPWMQGYVGVLAHPYFAVTGADGQFTLKNLPAGDYTLVAWHEKLGTREARATVAAKDTKDVTFTFGANGN